MEDNEEIQYEDKSEIDDKDITPQDQPLINNDINNNNTSTNNDNDIDNDNDTNLPKPNEPPTLLQNLINNTEPNQTLNNPNINLPNLTTSPLIQFTSLYYCQSCNSQFNTSTHLPYLFKCNHFFCKQCIQTTFLTSNGIKCPKDGIIANSLDDCTIITNIITPRQSNTCQLHKSQPFTHYVEETREIICVYCAFNKMRSNPKLTIKEIKEKIKEYIHDIDLLHVHHSQFANFLQELLDQINENKQSQQNKIITLFDQMISYLENKKKVLLNKIDCLYHENSLVINDKLNMLSHKVEEAIKLKNEFDDIENNVKDFNVIIDGFNEFIKDNNTKTQLDIIINEYNFAHDDENKAYKYINNFGDLKSKKKQFTFGMNNNNNNNNNEHIQQPTNIIHNDVYDDDNVYQHHSIKKQQQQHQTLILNNTPTSNRLASLNKYTCPQLNLNNLRCNNGSNTLSYYNKKIDN
jgi:hypothetical protein